jgi:MFS family permease
MPPPSELPKVVGHPLKRDVLGADIVRGPVTWYCYLLLAFFVFMLTIQGNIVPFLKSELHLSYRAVGLHASAIAVGAIVVGIFGDAIVRRFGRRHVLIVGTLGCVIGAVMLCLASTPWATIGSCAVIGFGGSFIPTVAFAVLADAHEDRRSVPAPARNGTPVKGRWVGLTVNGSMTSTIS